MTFAFVSSEKSFSFLIYCFTSKEVETITGDYKRAFQRFYKKAIELSRGHLVQGQGKTTHILNMCHSCKRNNNPVGNGKDDLEKSRNHVSGQPLGVTKCFLKHNLSPNCDWEDAMIFLWISKAVVDLKSVFIFPENY